MDRSAVELRVRQAPPLPGDPRGAGFLGINYNGMHDSSVALLDVEGRLLYAVGEERFSRVKQDGRFPRRALAHIALREIHAIGVPYLDVCPAPVATDAALAPLLHPRAGGIQPFPPVWRERLESIGPPLLFFDHHEMHAYTGFVLSGYPEAFAFTADYGAPNCPVTMAFYHVVRGHITRLAAVSTDDRIPLAGLYSDVTALLGFTVARHEGKVTGLAAHGRPSADCRRRTWSLHKHIQEFEHPLYGWLGYLSDAQPPSMESNRFLVGSYRAELPFSDADIARAAQDLLDEKLVAMLGVLADTHGRELPLILSGGVFANVRSNLELARVGFPKLFIAPPMGDDGLCIGAATAAFDTVGQSRPRRGHARSSRPMSMSVGPTPGVGIDDMLAELDVRYRRPPGDLLASELATALAQGLTVALVHGPQEFGPRALGDRSILAAASDPGINERLNHKLRRTEFMPFAPILRLERVTDVLQIEDIASDVRDCLPFMTICVPVRPWVAQAAPAVVHVDGTARPQAVSREDDPFLHELLSAYEIKTGIPVLINTSFNVHDQPLVSTARDALVGFLAAELDVLCLEGRVIHLASNEHLTRVARLMRRDLEAPLLRARLSGLSESFGAQMVNGPGPFGRQALSTPVAFDNA